MRLASFGKRAGLLTLSCLAAALVAQAQTRINDKDLENLMRNLRDDAKAFRPVFVSGLKKSTIRKTSQAKDAENLAKLFESQTQSLLNNFKQTKQGDAHLTGVQNSADRLSSIVTQYQLGPQVSMRWNKIQTELQQVLSAYGMNMTSTAVDNPRGITPTGGSGAGTCSEAVGPERAARLVQECLQVSPATHPPCNAQNACTLIIDEIRRGCGMLDPRDRPAFCNEYR